MPRRNGLLNDSFRKLQSLCLVGMTIFFGCCLEGLSQAKVPDPPTQSPARTVDPFDQNQIQMRQPLPRTQSGPAGVIFVQDIPSSAQAEHKKAVRLVREKRYDDAAQTLHRALEIFPDYFAALEALGALQMEFGQYDEASKTLDHALKLNPNASMSHYLKGSSQLLVGKIDAAIASYRRATELEPCPPNAHLMLGFALLKSRRYLEAEEPLKAAYSRGGTKMAEAHYYLAIAYDHQGRAQDAIESLQIFLKQAPRQTDRNKILNLIAKIIENISTHGKTVFEGFQ